MAELVSGFENLLKEIEPDDDAKAFAQKAHEPIRDHLAVDDVFGEYFESSFLYGSYKRQTSIIDIKDVDIIVLTKFDPNTTTPDQALRLLKAAIGRFYEIPNNEEYQTRSIKINHPLPNKGVEMTVDVVPAIPLNKDAQPLLVPDRDLKKWVTSNPKGHLEKTTQLNSAYVSGGQYVPLIKIMRWWWKYQSKLKKPKEEKCRPKGFMLECMVMETFDPKSKTLGAHFVNVLQNINNKYAKGSGVPRISDPGLPGEILTTGMSSQEFDFFLDVVKETLPIAQAALQERDEAKSLVLWQKVFSEKFNASVSKSLQAVNTDGYPASSEEFIENIVSGFEDRGYKFRIDGLVTADGFRPFQILTSPFSRISKQRKIEYVVVESTIDVPHSIKWKVKNRGDEAKYLNQLRGEITDGGTRKIEHSKYTGDHYVECYAVDENNICIARDKIDVPIE